MAKKFIPQQVKDADVIYVSHSGGKDSQAMLGLLMRMNLLHKVVIVHADLGDMEWEEMRPWIEKNSFGLPVNVVQSDMTFWSLVEKYGRFPSSRQQFCTDHLKTKPINEWIHDHMTKHGYTKAINATGMRAAESGRRALKKPITLSKGQHTSGMHMPRKYPAHTIHDWMPIFYYSEEEVYQEIDLVGQEPHHVYSLGFSRLSCVMCINGRIGEHKRAAELRPHVAKKMAELERKVGKTLRLKQRNKVKYPKYLDEYITISV